MSYKKYLKLFAPILIMSVLVFGLVGYYFHKLNQVNTLKQNCDAQYAQIQSVMQRRYDLVPNMVKLVKGDMKQERIIFKDLADARSSFYHAKTKDDQIKSNKKIGEETQVLVNVIREHYPKLASDHRVRDLMVELEGSENRINQERRKYNKCVQQYNTFIGNYPTKLIANAGGYHELDYFKADQMAQRAPTVDLD